MFFLVPGFSVAAKCTVIGAACITVAAVEVLQARSLLESFKTKAGSAFSFKWRASARPSEHSSAAHCVPVAPEVDSDDSPDFTNPAVCLAGGKLPVFGVLETGATNDNNEITKASVATTDDTVKFDSDHCACTLQPSAVDIAMLDLDKLPVEAAVDGDPAAASDDAGEHLDSTSHVVAGVQTGRGSLSLMPDLEGEAADVRIKAVRRLAAIGVDPHLDPIVDENAEVMADVIKAQLASSIGNSCGANNPDGRSWARRFFKGTRDFVMPPINSIRSRISKVFNNAGDFLRGFIDRIRSWFGKMYGGIYGCVETIDPVVCAIFLQILTGLAVGLKKWILDHQVILKKILLVLVDFFMETPSFWAHHKSDSRLLSMRLYRLLRSELRW